MDQGNGKRDRRDHSLGRIRVWLGAICDHLVKKNMRPTHGYRI